MLKLLNFIPLYLFTTPNQYNIYNFHTYQLSITPVQIHNQTATFETVYEYTPSYQSHICSNPASLRTPPHYLGCGLSPKKVSLGRGRFAFLRLASSLSLLLSPSFRSFRTIATLRTTYNSNYYCRSHSYRRVTHIPSHPSVAPQECYLFWLFFIIIDLLVSIKTGVDCSVLWQAVRKSTISVRVEGGDECKIFEARCRRTTIEIVVKDFTKNLLLDTSLPAFRLIPQSWRDCKWE